ncbi:PREDICTED: unknown [Prunus dulcis]|uniref:Uncharacterized protein n=1 Tax=Prunus dulcis TaxID=3755 RepID=A0A5E4EN51_PRUDU|nr:protein MODIFYING WALL LIGNIN-1 [Prunus dulcis]VVA17127.1 PREDICTED: unknown [Prunus dulcis]
MEKHQYELVLILFIVASLGLVSIISCIAAEIKKTKEEELTVIGRLCHLPESQAFGFGVAALICLFAAQMVGNLIVCTYFCSRERKKKSGSDFSISSKAKTPTIWMALACISWTSFVMAVTLLSSATSMSRDQPYGQGWLDGQCYLVKQGIYIGSGILVLIAIGSTLGLIIIITTMRQTQVDEGSKAKEQSKLNTKS